MSERCAVETGAEAPPREGSLAPQGEAIPSYRATLKPIAVEELIDLALHRPLAWAIARASYRTAVTPDQLTWLSMVVGVAAGGWILHALQTGAGFAPAGWLLVLSAVVDCSDGQLARMRRTSSTYGRMLDGAVDAIVQASLLPGLLLMVWSHHRAEGPAALGLWTLLWLAGVWSTVQHTSLYDRYKNLYLRNTQPGFDEDDDDDDVDAQWREAAARGPTFAEWLRYFVYRSYLRAQRDLFRRVDPSVPARFRDMPPRSPENAARYRAASEALMRAWTFYGIGTHIFACAIAIALDRVEWYIAARLLLWNGALVALIPLQRRASRAFFGAPA